MSEVLEVKNLSVSISADAGMVQAVCDVSLTLQKGETLAVVGESGCGKSTLCKSVMKLLPENARIRSGRIAVCGTDIIGYSERDMRGLRGNVCSMISQHPMTSLDPAMTVGSQMAEAVLAHDRKQKKEEVYARVMALMELVGIEYPRERYRLYPWHFSGGMRQRIAIAMALAGNPDLLLADEPTTALDVTIQAQILDLLREIQEKRNTAMLLVSHDLGVVARVADRVAIMQAGEIVETGTAEEIFDAPRHPYTKSLLQASRTFAGGKSSLAVPGLSRTGHSAGTCRDGGVILDVRHLTQRFRLSRKRVIRAVDDVSFQIRRGEIFGLIGESGSGKSTVARCLMNLCPSAEGHVFFDSIDTCNKSQYRANRRRLEDGRQLVFQDSVSSLNPRMKVADLIAEPMVIRRRKPPRGSLRAEVASQLEHVGLDEGVLDAYPPELSGGERQRVAIARALFMEPELLIADEPVTSLDVITQAQILSLFRHLREEHGFSILFIAHDLAVVASLCDRIGVMVQGKLVELAPVAELFGNPAHPYTRALLSAIPLPDPRQERERARIDFDGLPVEYSGDWQDIGTEHFVRREEGAE